MKRITITLFFLALSVNSYALGGYNSYSEGTKKTLSLIIDQLGVKDSNHSVKTEIYNLQSYMFDSNWNSYWLGLNDLSASKLKDGNEKGYIEICINNKENGTLFFTYVYKPEVKQIIITSRQVRHGSRSGLLEVYEKRKGNKDEFELHHETDSYALLQEKGKVDLNFFHVTESTGSIVYVSQTVIDVP